MGAANSQGLNTALSAASEAEVLEAMKKLSDKDRANLSAALKATDATNPLKIGANVPDFNLKTTTGDFSFHSFLTGDAEKPWTLFFSHPNDFTPVCTTELGTCHSLSADFGKMGTKLIGLSCNTTDSHHAWSKDVLANSGATGDALAFPIIADADRNIVSTLGMLDPEEVTAEGMPLPARALIIFHGTTVRLTILYPASVGRNFQEVKRILTSLQLTASNGLATPVNWTYGEKLIVGPAVKTEDAKAKFQEFNMETLPSGKEYLRTVKCLDLTPEMSKTAAAANTAKPPSGPNPLKLGAIIPNFDVKTTKGDFSLHTWLTESDKEKPWTIFFTHPKDFTPVCTTELGVCHKLAEKAAKLGCKLIGLSCDDTESHKAWSKDVLARCGCAGEEALAFPIIADSDRKIVTKMGMLDPEERDGAGVPLPARALLILKGTTVKLSIVYPATTGRDFDEVLRTLVSLQLTANQGLATPVDWKYGERVIVAPCVATEEAKEKFKDFQQKELPSGKPYLRSVQCPEAGLTAP